MESPFVKLSDVLKNSSIIRKYSSAFGDSPIEDKLAGCLARFGVKVELQKQIGKYRVDIFIETKFNKIVVECDGAEFHTDKEKDRQRDLYLEALGYLVLRFTGSQINRSTEGCAVRVIENISEVYQSKNFQRYLEVKLKASEDLRLDPEYVQPENLD